MILRRITQHVKGQNWFAVILDFIIVVVGILIAFQLTNWNEAQTDRKRESQILHQIAEAIEAIGVVLEESTKRKFQGYLAQSNKGRLAI